MGLQLIHAAGRNSKIYYDKEKDIYIKHFKKYKWYTRRGMKTGLNILKTPGKNIEDITKRLQEAKIACPELLEVEDYKVSFRKCENALTLGQYRKIHGPEVLRAEQVKLMIKLLGINLIHADPHDGNFLYNGEEIIVIDLDALRSPSKKFLPRQLMLYRIWKHSNQNYSFAYQVADAWPERTSIERMMDSIYTFRTYLKVHILRGNKNELIFLKQINKYFKEKCKKEG